MTLQIAIVGLPNVGKSTLFNALTKTKAAIAANYPFCTIDPNVGVVEVPDERMKAIAKIVNPQRILPTIIEFVDVAGLVKGASTGEGLGNQFLSHIRECDAICQVLRIFEDSNVTHVSGIVDPQQDKEIIESELIMADLQTVEKRLNKAKSDCKSGDKKKIIYAHLVERLFHHLNEDKLASLMLLNEEEKEDLKDLHLLTMKPIMYVFNVAENQVADFDLEKTKKDLGIDINCEGVAISAQIESELIDMSEQEAMEFLEDMGLKESGLNSLIRIAYKTLGLKTYFTAGEKEVRAWTIKSGTLAPQAAGVIHSDFEKGFIRAETVFWKDFIECAGRAKAREKGLLKSEGKEYEVKDGDIMEFLFSS